MEQVDTTEYPWAHLGDRKKFFHLKRAGCEEYLKQNMRFSFVVVEIKRKCVGSLFHPSTCKPVSVKERSTGVLRGIDLVFETFIPAAPVGFYTEMVKCEVKITSVAGKKVKKIGSTWI
ncbi:hypothetical protein MtrunA17_Chr5g0399581 [Medicago truncatula]|uniref:Uncharacterized protein n=2 Tax=Medicago truncatula TaxID=3880 RepID=A0A396HKB4_MEDTR|nr:hypothetical protein MtrunA17_Chr5g0399581 [Medicago truncatula]